jgi:hypothetical protein
MNFASTRGKNMIARSLKDLIVILAISPAVAYSDADSGPVVSIHRDDYLRLAVSDQLREQTGLWQDRLHWRVILVEEADAKSDYWKGLTTEPGKKTIVVFLDHPNGVDKMKYHENNETIKAAALSAVEAVLKRYSWSSSYVVHTVYIDQTR